MRKIRPIRVVSNTVHEPVHIKSTFKQHDPKVVKAIAVKLIKNPADHSGNHRIIKHYPSKPNQGPVDSRGAYKHFMATMYMHRSRANLSKRMGRVTPNWVHNAQVEKRR